jgi:rhodanese-related sulfurtransferase
LLEAGGVFVDVRSEMEFRLGHVPGAYNVPIMQPEFDQLKENPRFIGVMLQVFPKHTRLVLGCHSGGRSSRARVLLETEGYSDLYELGPGFDGRRDDFGRLSPGWRRLELPIEEHAQPGRSYHELDPHGSLA